MAILIAVDGTETEIVPDKGKKMSLEQMQRLVEGYIEPFYLGANEYLIVNEDGRVKQMPFNRRATAIARHPIVGPAILCHKKEWS